jgi:F-type H+-transporting ATPase subunit gamma
MANLHDVRLRIKAIQQTLKVTSAMNLISTAKLRKAKKLLSDSQPYFKRIQLTMAEILRGSGNNAQSVFVHNKNAGPSVLPQQKRSGRPAVIAVTTDKGLAGGYNANVARAVNELCATLDNPVLIIVGAVGQRYFTGSQYQIVESFSYQGRMPTVTEAVELSDFVISQYEWGFFSEVHIVYTHMVNTLKQVAEQTKVLPLEYDMVLGMEGDGAGAKPEQKQSSGEEFEYIPSKEDVFNTLVPQYISGVFYGCLVESYTSEQSSRMTAMDTASRNAKDMISQQQLFYNRVRQAGITQEVTEIVAGSSALQE